MKIGAKLLFCFAGNVRRFEKMCREINAGLRTHAPQQNEAWLSLLDHLKLDESEIAADQIADHGPFPDHSQDLPKHSDKFRFALMGVNHCHNSAVPRRHACTTRA